MVDSNPETEDNKENVDVKEEEVASKFLNIFLIYLIECICFYFNCPASFCVSLFRNFLFMFVSNATVHSLA
jgi:hypothetical protein